MENPMLSLFASCHRAWLRRWMKMYPRFGRFYGFLTILYVSVVTSMLVVAGQSQGGAPGALLAVLLELVVLGLIAGGTFSAGCTYGGLASLRQGRCLEEFQAAGVKPEQIVDGLAQGSLRALFPWVWGWWGALLVMGTMLCTTSATWGWMGLALSVCAFPLLLLTSASACLLGARAGMGQTRDWLVVIASYLSLAALVGVAQAFSYLAVPLLGLGIPALTAASLFLARRETIRRVASVGEATTLARKPRAAAVVGECDPITARERMRAHSWSWWGRHWDGLAALGLGLFYGGAALFDNPGQGPVLSGVPCLVVLSSVILVTPLRCLWRGLEVFQTDQRARTFESLLSTRITAREALSGAASAACQGPLRESLVITALLLPLSLLLYGPDLSRVLPKVAGWVLVAYYFVIPLAVAGSFLGIGAGARAQTRQEAWMRLGIFWIQLYGALVVCMVGLAAVVQWGGQEAGLITLAALGLASPWMLLAVTRRRALGALSHRPGQIGFA